MIIIWIYWFILYWI